MKWILDSEPHIPPTACSPRLHLWSPQAELLEVTLWHVLFIQPRACGMASSQHYENKSNLRPTTPLQGARRVGGLCEAPHTQHVHQQLVLLLLKGHQQCRVTKLRTVLHSGHGFSSDLSVTPETHDREGLKGS